MTGAGNRAPGPRAVAQLLSRSPPEGPRAPGTELPAQGARAEEGARSLDPGGGGRSSRGGPAPSSAAEPRPGRPRGPRRNFSLEAPAGRARAPTRARASRSPPPPRARSVYFSLPLSLSHSKIGQGVEVTPGTAPGSDAKAAFSPRLRESVATIRFGRVSRPHTVQKAPATVALTMVRRGERRRASFPP